MTDGTTTSGGVVAWAGTDLPSLGGVVVGVRPDLAALGSVDGVTLVSFALNIGHS
jgi:hypothetical protein